MTLYVTKDGWLKAIKAEELSIYESNGWKQNVKHEVSGKKNKKQETVEEEE